MYTVLKNYQILITLLKIFGVKHFLLSAGTRNVPFVHSVGNDPDFNCYSDVDGCNVAYFTMGIAQESDILVIIYCIYSTATNSYSPAITEAYHLGAPSILFYKIPQLLNLYQGTVFIIKFIYH